MASISHRNVDNPLRGQIADSYVVALGFKPTIRRQAQTLQGSSGDTRAQGGGVRERASKPEPDLEFVLWRSSEAVMNQNCPACPASEHCRLITRVLRRHLDVSVLSHISMTHSFFSHNNNKKDKNQYELSRRYTPERHIAL